jgi:hypothetical protein
MKKTRSRTSYDTVPLNSVSDYFFKTPKIGKSATKLATFSKIAIYNKTIPQN